MKKAELKSFLDEKADRYNTIKFVDEDPILVPHEYSKKEDIEISGFLAASIAWGKRSIIIRNAKSMLERMDNDPYDFTMNASRDELSAFDGFVHRTFNAEDAKTFVLALRNIYKSEGMEALFASGNGSIAQGIERFRNRFFEINHQSRTQKHVSSPAKGSSSKRLNMFLRWMVRSDNRGVDFGIWETISPSSLYLPLDVHTGNISRKLDLLSRKQNDWKAVVEVSKKLKELDPIDPMKYDFALFGLGVYEEF